VRRVKLSAEDHVVPTRVAATSHHHKHLLLLGKRTWIMPGLIRENAVGNFRAHKEPPGPPTQEGLDQRKVEHVCKAGRKSLFTHGEFSREF
jgi:hypothetical protein